MKLSKRLARIERMVAPGYTHIWDCGCDHGYLGAALLSRQAAASLHFVDIVPELIIQVEAKLQRFYADSASRWQTHCIDVAHLPLEEYQGRHLVIIAGVGGDQMTRMIDAIHNKHKDVHVDFLLCPVHHQYALRQKLIALGFGLKHECLIEDNGRFYEILLISSPAAGTRPITPVGDEIWQSASTAQSETIKNYLNNTLAHYQRMQQEKSIEVDHIIDAYRAVAL